MVVGGTSSEYTEDFEGPQIELFMSIATSFLEALLMLIHLCAKLYDENGINTVSNGIGHDMLAVIDEESSNPIVLNDFYESDIDSYKSGIIDYPFAFFQRENIA